VARIVANTAAEGIHFPPVHLVCIGVCIRSALEWHDAAVAGGVHFRHGIPHHFPHH
jgi:hypothetical protein